MATAEAGVCNVALLRIGQLQTINSLDDKTPPAKACKTLWDFTRDQVLQARPWAFATFRKSLAVATGPARAEWLYAYSLAFSDFIAARYIWAGVENPGKEQEVPYKIEGSSAGRILLTNKADASLVYTSRVTEVSRWDALFSECMAMKLGSDLALGVAKKPALATELFKLYVAALGTAAASSGNQNQPLPSPVSEFERARG